MDKKKQEEVRINKYIASSGFCSRRQADEMVEKRKVFINQKVAKMGDVVKTGDVVKIDRKTLVKPKSKYVYILLNKPKGIICTTDKTIKNNIVDFVGLKERIFPVGRLDQNSSGLILLTNDGSIVNKILREENNHNKEYLVKLDKAPDEEFMQKMSSGVKILGQKTKPCHIQQVGENSVKIILTQGLNRQIRRMCQNLGYFVKDLKRTKIMDFSVKGMGLGTWRFLSQKEVLELKKDLKNNPNI